MKERPILFSGPMVRAILEGRKTQTRRIVKPQPDAHLEPNLVVAAWDAGFVDVPCPYGRPKDRLWVRETWQFADWTEDGYPFIEYRADGKRVLIERGYDEEWAERLTDIWADLSDPKNYSIDNRAADRKWRSPLFLPRWASRLALKITDVRVQRLQDISDEDARAEGRSLIPGDPAGYFPETWEAINGKGAWAENPWVWAITFTQRKPGEDRP